VEDVGKDRLRCASDLRAKRLQSSGGSRKSPSLNGNHTFGYGANGFLTSKQMPEGNTPFTQTYDTIDEFFFEGQIL